MAARTAGLGLLASLVPTLAFAAEGGAHPSETVFLVQIVVLLAVGRTLGEVMQRIGQPSIMGQLLAGIVLGPSGLGLVAPDLQAAIFPAMPEQKAMLDAVSQLGILMLLLLTGMETDLALVRKVGRAAASVSVTGIAIPFACGFALGELLPASMLPRPELRLITSLFLGTALSISSVKIVAMVVREMDFLRRNVGQVIVASAIIDDTIGWIIIAVIFSLAQHGSVDLWGVGRTVAGTLIFLGLSFTLGRRLVFVLIRWANDELVSEGAVVSMIIAIMGLLALFTQGIGVHTVLGAFVAGILVGQSPILTGRIDEELRGLITGLFAPVFFGLAGLSSDLTILKDPRLALLTVGLIVIASVGKFAGAFAGGAIGGMKPAESLALASGMNARGSTEVIVATIGLSIGALSHDLFTMIVAMAFMTTMAMPPMLRWALGRLPMDAEERARLEREAFEDAAFVPKLERLLVVADQSPKGRFASRIAGLIAGSRGMPVTVVRSDGREAAQDQEETGELRAIIERTAERVKAGADADSPAADRPPVAVTERAGGEGPERQVAEASAKGFDLLVLGHDPTGAETGGLAPEVADLAGRFEGPVAIVTARGQLAAEPERGEISLLIPVSGTDVSRRGAEIGLAIAKSSGASVTALFCASPPNGAKRSVSTGRRTGEAVLKAVAAAAEQYGVALKTELREAPSPGEAVLREARLGQHDLIVMGVARRTGDVLAFGDTAEAVLDASEASVAFVAS